MTVVSRYVGTATFLRNNSNYTFSSPSFAVGAPDGQEAGFRSGTNTVSAGGMLLSNFGLNIPAGAMINSVTCQLTGYSGTSTAGGARFVFRQGSNTGTLIGTSAYFIGSNPTFTAPGTYTADVLNNLSVEWQAPQKASSMDVAYVTVDAFQITVDYTEAPTGPTIKRLDANGNWVNTTIRKRFDGTNWVNITTVQKL